MQGIIEQANTNGSEYQYLIDAGIDVRSHTGVPHIMHHKYAIIDQALASSDPLVITGSHNWSAAAENSNDENTVFTTTKTLPTNTIKNLLSDTTN